MWKRFRHRNIVRFIGVTQGPLQFVSEWMPNGTLRQYLAKNPDADRIDLVSFSPVIAALLMTFFPSYWA